MLHALFDGYGDDLIAAQGRHLTELPVFHQLHGLGPEARAEQPVEGRRMAPSLQMAEDQTSGFLAGFIMNFLYRIWPSFIASFYWRENNSHRMAS